MKKLDAGIKSWLFSLILGAITWFVIPFIGMPSTFETLVRYTAVLVIAVFGLAIYGIWLAATANQAANYNKIEEAYRDINGDVRSFAFFLIATTALICIVIMFYGFIKLLNIPANLVPTITNDTKWIYSILTFFHAGLTLLRNYERRLTVNNALNRFYEMNPTRLATGA